MFGFMRKSGVRSPSEPIRRAIESGGLPAGVDAASALGVVESPGNYSGRRVTFIRVFSPTQAAEREVQVGGFTDLDAHPELVLISGLVEKDGTVMLNQRASAVGAPPAGAANMVRERADRTMQRGDNGIVFPDDNR